MIFTIEIPDELMASLEERLKNIKVDDVQRFEGCEEFFAARLAEILQPYYTLPQEAEDINSQVATLQRQLSALKRPAIVVTAPKPSERID